MKGEIGEVINSDAIAAAPARLAGILLVGSALLVLAACGFQLRGEARLPAVMAATHLQVPDDSSPFARELELRLRANGVRLVGAGEAGAARLRIVRERIRREALSISGDARVREFDLVYEVEFSLQDGDGEVLIAPEVLRMRRDFRFDEQEILAATREEEFLRAELTRAMAAQLIRRLETVGT